MSKGNVHLLQFSVRCFHMTTLTFSPPETRLWKTFLNKHSRVSYDIKQKPVLTQQLHSSRQQLPQLKAWIGLSVQTWRSSRGPQAAIIRLAAADNCHQTKQDREILPLYPQPPPHTIFTSSSAQNLCFHSWSRPSKCALPGFPLMWHQPA